MKGKLPQRKQIRLKEYNYSQEGYYFITICTQNRKCILSKIINDEKLIENIVGVDAHIDPKKEKIHIELLKAGKIIEKYIINYNKKFDNIKIYDYIIMPNHIHLIIKLISGSMWASTPTIPNIIKSLKTICTKEYGEVIWQRNYYEHVIRDEKEYYLIKNYIQNNPLNWETDIYNEKENPNASYRKLKC